MRKYFTTLLICLAFAAQAQTIKQLTKDMYGIASDATEGRFTGSSGYYKAAKYVASQLKAAGLKTKFQTVPFIWDNYEGSTIVVNGRSYRHAGGNFIVLEHSPAATGDWVFFETMPDSTQTADLLKRHVAGVILPPNEQQRNDWETTVIRQYRFGYMHYAAGYAPAKPLLNIIMVSPEIAKELQNGQQPVVHYLFKRDRINGYNIIAKLAGTNQSLKHQTVIAGAHLDHIGRLGSHIYNGANDDGSGCVALLAAARSLAQHPAKRPVMFVFYCGEELNLLGSRYFMEHPPIPIQDMLMNINLEQLGSKHRSFDGVWALGDLRFQKAFFAAGSAFGGASLKFSVTDSVRDVLMNTDSYHFIRKEVPSLLLGSGGFDEHHSPLDKIDLIDFVHLQKASRLLCRLIREVAN